MDDNKKGEMGPAGQLLKCYRGLHSRFVDLVGDYTGDETLILEGDSMLLHCFSDPHLDFNVGLQLLHAVYLVEKLLENLKRRHCNFVVVFFDCHQQLCVPHHVSTDEDSLTAKYLMAREVIISHLQANTTHDQHGIIRRFPSYEDIAFQTFVEECGAYFMMCHDGSRPNTDPKTVDVAEPPIEESLKEKPRSEDSESDTNESDQSTESDESLEPSNFARPQPNYALKFRRLILWSISKTFKVVLLNGIEFHDSRVMATALELVVEETLPLPSLEALEVQPDVETHAWIESVSAADMEDFSQRESLSVFTLAEMHRDGHLKPEREQDMKYMQAFLVHCVLLASTPLGYRAIDLPDGLVHGGRSTSKAVFIQTCRTATQIMHTKFWEQHIASMESIDCDIADFIDGRFFLATLSQLESGKSMALDSESFERLHDLADIFEDISGVDLDISSCARTGKFAEGESPESGSSSSNATFVSSNSDTRSFESGVLPFSHVVFDVHLASVHISTNTRKHDVQHPSSSAARIFGELSYWHSYKRPIDPQKLQQPVLTGREQKSHQRQMAEMRDYAASLTNVSGGILKPETIIEGSVPDKLAKAPEKSDTRPTAGGKTPQKKGGPIRKGGKAAALEAANVMTKKKQDKAIDSALSGWVNIISPKGAGTTGKTKQLVVDPVAAYINAERYMTKLPEEKREIVVPDVLCYMLQALYIQWKRNVMDSGKPTTARPFHIAARCWFIIDKIRQLKKGISAEINACAQEIIRVLGLPPIKLDVDSNRPISVNFPGIDYQDASKTLRIGISHLEFQLVHMGPYLDKSMGSAPDPRVPTFEPDEWQRRVLDQIDRKNSLLVVAPTSAGKTFISFYAMRQVLVSDSDGVLVYVAPTKALVNQIAAEVQARFSKQFKHGGKSVWAIHTRDYRINNPTGCQVLVTVPHILQIMLMAPSNAKSWSKRVRYIIFDEVHCIGQAEDGLVWEQLLLMAPCPIIALSATVGNPQSFSDWLAATRSQKGPTSGGNNNRNGTNEELVMIEHRHRYSDLRKFVYQPPELFSFSGLQSTSHTLKLGLDDTPSFEFMHPYASLSNTARGIPSDLALEPRDCWILWQSMKKHQTVQFSLDKSLDPSVVLPDTVRKLDVVAWQFKLDEVLKSWMGDPDSPFEDVLADLQSNVLHQKRPKIQVSEIPDTRSKQNVPSDVQKIQADALTHTTLPLICSLHEQNALPALFFNYDRYGCEEIAMSLLTQLQDAENRFKNTSAEWAKKLAQWNSWKERKEEEARKGKKTASKPAKKTNVDKEEMGPEDAAGDTDDSGLWATFDPEDPVDGFHLAGKKMSASRVDFAVYQQKLQWRGVPTWLITALRRGVGVHHAGMNRKYRQICEMLFRNGYLRVVIATGTLALGINMPCKTVVFSGDSIFLTALNFRQAAGRAGRRGFDLLGNVVFQNIPYPRICRLLTSRLPELRGHFPITTSLILRMFTLLYGSGGSEYARKAVSALLSVPRIYIDGLDESKSTVLHHLRFSIEYLRRNYLLSASGKPLNFTSIISHLYYQENSAFAFHALLKEGYLHRLCGDILATTGAQRAARLRTLMLVMAHLFGREKIQKSLVEKWTNNRKKMGSLSPSVVILPSLPPEAKEILRNHNDETKDIFANYVRTFAEQHLKEKPDDKLPFSNRRFGGHGQDGEKRDGTKVAGTLGPTRQPTKVTSAFVALSGNGDEWDSIEDLCSTVRSGIWLEQAVVPHVPIENTEDLNAYLYDFYSHGDITALQIANGIRKSDVWYMLNDFSMVLATIVAAFNNFLKISPEGDADADMINVQGLGDTIDDAVADDYDHIDSLSNPSAHAIAGMSRSAPKTKKAVFDDDEEPGDVPDSWDAGSDDDSDDTEVGTEGQLGDGANGRSPDDKSGGMMGVLRAFRLLRAEFDEKFKATWA